MILLDSNIIIYSAGKEYKTLRDFILNNDVFCSAISKLEVLGFHRITNEQKEYFELLFDYLTILPISNDVIDLAISQRSKKNMSVGDSIISASSILNDCVLYTNNVKDFDKIDGLKIFNPITN